MTMEAMNNEEAEPAGASRAIRQLRSQRQGVRAANRFGFGRPLDDFLINPTSTMSVVLGSQIHLTDDERREAFAKLKVAYQKKVEQEAKAKPNK